jgi:hypothetical protein
MQEQKRHHFVPEFYLIRFATETERVLERRRDGVEFVTNTDNVAAASGFYDIMLPDGKKSKEVENHLSTVEGDAAEVLRTIDTSMSAPPPGSEERTALSVYLGLQMTRTRELREQIQFPLKVAEFLCGRDLTHELIAEFLEEIHLGFPPSEGEVKGAFDYSSFLLQDPASMTRERSMELMFDAAQAVVPRLTARNWCIEHDRKGRLVTSDTPLVLWRRPSPRDAYEGVGVEDADEIRFPLDPNKQLIMTKRERSPSARISPERSATCNQDVALGCHNFVVAHPSQQTRVAQLDLPKRRPVLRFNSGPLVREQPDGTTIKDGEVMHTWVPRR